MTEQNERPTYFLVAHSDLIGHSNYDGAVTTIGEEEVPSDEPHINVSTGSSIKLLLDKLREGGEIGDIPEDWHICEAITDARGRLAYAHVGLDRRREVIYWIEPENPGSFIGSTTETLDVLYLNNDRKVLYAEEVLSRTLISETSVFDRMQEVDSVTKKLSRRGPVAHAGFFGKSVREVFPPGKKVVVVGDPFFVFGQADWLGCDTLSVIEYEPQVEVKTPLFSLVNGISLWDGNLSPAERMKKWLDGQYEYDWKTLYAQGFKEGVGLDYDLLHYSYDHTDNKNLLRHGVLYHSLYGAFSDICRMVEDVSKVSGKEAKAEDNIPGIIELYEKRYKLLTDTYSAGFYGGMRSSLDHRETYYSRDEAFKGLVDQAIEDWGLLPATCRDSELGSEIRTLLTRMQEFGENSRAGSRLSRPLSRKTNELLGLDEDTSGDASYSGTDRFRYTVQELRGLMSKNYEERVVEQLLGLYERHLIYFKSIYPNLHQDYIRMRHIGVPERTIELVTEVNETEFWKTQFRVSHEGDTTLVHGFFPNISLPEDSQDVIVSVYAHTAHGWNVIHTAEEFTTELANEIRFLKVGGKMYAGPINYKVLVALQRDYDASTDYRNTSQLADALDALKENGTIDFEVVYPASMEDESNPYNPRTTRFIRERGFANGIIVTRLK